MALTPIPRKRLHARLDARLLDLAQREADQRRIPLQSILDAALRERYDPERDVQGQHEVLKEVRGLRQEIRQVSFGNRMLVELSTLTTKNLFACLPAPTPASQLAGHGFYTALLAAVEKVFTQDTPVLDRLMATLLQADDAVFDDEATGAA